MNLKGAISIAGLAVLAVSSFATAPIDLGPVSLDLVGYTNGNGTFEWKVDGTSTIVYTFCMSTNNYIGGNPQHFEAYNIAGSNAADIASSGILADNDMAGLTATHFLEAAAQAESFGIPGPLGTTALDNSHNAAIHTTESLGDSSFDGADYSHFIYLQSRDANGAPTHSGQPQGLVVENPNTNPSPEPASMAALGVGLLGIIRRARRRS